VKIGANDSVGRWLFFLAKQIKGMLCNGIGYNADLHFSHLLTKCKLLDQPFISLHSELAVVK
jgi:hypothetical protein